MRRLTGRCLLFITIWSFTVGSLPSDAQRARGETPSATSATISSKTPVFAGACKACPWGILAKVTADALRFYGYDTTICWVCWSNFGPREMADKTKPVVPPGAEENPYVEPPPDAVPDISATSEINLIEAWNGKGAYAPDHKKRQKYRIIAAVQQPNFLMLAANKKSGITDLSQVKTRTQPTWIAFTNRDKPVDEVLEY